MDKYNTIQDHHIAPSLKLSFQLGRWLLARATAGHDTALQSLAAMAIVVMVTSLYARRCLANGCRRTRAGAWSRGHDLEKKLTTLMAAVLDHLRKICYSN